MSEENQKRYTEEYRIYKPGKNGPDGSATKIGIVEFYNRKGYKKLSVFLTSAQEVPSSDPNNAAFGWEDPSKRVIAQLGDPDLTEIMMVIDGRKPGLGMWKQDKNAWSGLFHRHPSNDKDNTLINLTETEKKDGFYYSLSSSRGGDKVRIAHKITFQEAYILRSVIESYWRIKYGTLS